ncbi:SusC/RagA family TonB-linked outer membrane protein [Sediminibacterium salmoneum]|uniref:SusC/RagA family TonB-linked outer membrane protein n=1 Tax=Sediminibacterium salmoneum TaxID=426421 RepID=UPI0004AF0F65|nr:SusC/RagA family TonB-linked outer membrane protein [Sediminibacterium salmoneum]
MRKLAYVWRIAFLLFFLVMKVSAQDITVTGNVSDLEKGSPLESVSIRVVGKSTATKTDARGNFTIKAAKGQVLLITSLGYETQRVGVKDDQKMIVRLKAESSELEDVVVVAMDQKRKPRELGYSTQQVKGAELQETQRDNFVNSLQGRVAGLTVNPTSGTVGASSQIVLRGFNSLSLSNQPLFVVDGVIMDNSSFDETSDGGRSVGLASDRPNRGSDYTNRISDLNPNDIENVTVLKGPEATALYGSQASSGAIVITTRKAKTSKLAVQYDNSFRVQVLNRFPPMFDGYTNGTNNQPSNIFRYFGPAYPSGTRLYDNIGAFFRNGKSQTHNLGVDFGIKKSIFRFSASYLKQEGVVPNNDQEKINLSLRNTTKIGKWIEITPSIAYTRTNTAKVLRSAGGYLIGLMQFPNTVDVSKFEDDGGNKLPLFSANANAEVDNPLWNVQNNRGRDQTDRLFTSLGINLNPTSWLSITGRFGYDTYKTIGYQNYHPQSFFVTTALRGSQDNFWNTYKGYNHTINATAKKTFGDFSVRAMAGTMWQDYRTEVYAVSGNNVADPNRTDSNNTAPNTRVRLLRNNYGEPNLRVIRQIAYFGELALSYKNLLFFNYSHRFESASTLPAANRNYNYPGLSLSAIMTDILPGLKKGGVLNYWKLRGSMANTARLNSAYSTQSVFVNNFGSANGPAYSYGFTNNNADLKPERQSTYEIGTEFKFFKNRLSVDATYYNTLTKGQIVENFRLSYATGFVLNTQNAASTRNEGVEIAIDYQVTQKKDFGWNVRLNFNKMWNAVVAFPPNVSEFYISDTWLYGNARASILGVGSPTTGIASYGYARNNAGQILINPSTGLPSSDNVFKLRGDRNPAFSLGIQNSFRYKNWRLSFLWDLKIGGDIFNATK